MVPVPEDLVDEVQDFLAWGVKKPDNAPKNPTAVAELYAEAPPEARALLQSVAVESLNEARPTLLDVAEGIGLSSHAIVGMLTELNFRLRALEGPMAIAMLRDDPRPMPEGRNPWEHRILHMTPEVAQLIADPTDAA